MNKLFAAVSAVALLASFAADAQPISGFPTASTPLNGSEAAIGTQSAATVQITTASIAALAWAGVLGDCTITTGGNITCTKTSGVAFGNMSAQASNAVAITGGAINGTVVGNATAAAGNFSTLGTTGNVTDGGNLSVTGHTTSGGSAPSCKTNCASVSGTDARMAIVGNASITSVAVTFATAWASTPICTANGNATGIGTIAIAANLTTLTATFTSSTPTIYASCGG